jgi:hypothetical protein
LTAVQQRATGLRALADQPTEGVGRIGVSVRIDVQVPFSRDPDRRMAEPPANDF